MDKTSIGGSSSYKLIFQKHTKYKWSPKSLKFVIVFEIWLIIQIFLTKDEKSL